MKKTLKISLMVSLLFALSLSSFAAKDKVVKVVIKTNKGDIFVDLYQSKAPISVKNFLTYVDKKFYNGLIFHRVIKNFMIQGGGFDQKFTKKSPAAAIKNEANNGLKNEIGTLAMARTNVVDSATSQFFINTKDNGFLNHQGASNFGYAVFGKVVKGMPVIKQIENSKTTVKNGRPDVPVDNITIKSIERL